MIAYHEPIDYVETIRAGSPFSFVRYGDGEWACIRGDTAGKNCDGNHYSEGLQRLLIESLTKAPPDPYYLGMQPLAMQLWGAKIEGWLEGNGVRRRWMNADIFHKASEHGQLLPFVRVLKKRPSLLVAPAYMGALGDVFTGHVAVAPRDCWQDKGRIVSEIVSRGRGAVVCCALGPSAAPIIQAAYAQIGGESWLLDVGSLFDPYVRGGRTRRYFKKITPAIRAANGLGE